MLIRELLFEYDTPVEEITNSLMDMVVAYIDRGLTKIPMTGPSGMVEYMKKMGQMLSSEDIMKALEDPMFDNVVERSDPNQITLSGAKPEGVSKPQMQKSKEKVQKDAETQAAKNIKLGGKP